MAKKTRKKHKKVRDKYDEQWVEFGFECEIEDRRYFCSNYARLKSVVVETGVETLLKGTFQSRGHHVIGLKHAKTRKSMAFFVQKLVAEAFCEKTSEEQTFVIHLDNNLANNHYTNLQWVSRDELTEHFRKNGVWDPKKKKRNSAYKMNPSRVRLLKKRIKEGKTKKSILAKSFNITPEQLRKIEKGIDWAWVDADDDKKEASK